MYHTKEISNNAQPVKFEQFVETDTCFNRDTLEQKRFGDLSLGDHFVFNNQMLVKTGEYNAVSDKKMGKSEFIFFKKDMIKIKRPESKLVFKSLYDNEEYAKRNLDEISNACKNTSKWVIIIQVDKKPILTIRENDVIVSAQDICSDIHGFWDAKVKIMGIDMVLTYDGKQRFTLSYNDEMVWSSPFNHSWDYVECCVISINNEIALMK